MPCAYSDCQSADVRRTEHRILTDSYQCKACNRSYTRISPTAGRWALRVLIVGGITVLTGGLDGGLAGSAAAAAFVPDADDVVDTASDAATDE